MNKYFDTPPGMAFAFFRCEYDYIQSYFVLMKRKVTVPIQEGYMNIYASFCKNCELKTSLGSAEGYETTDAWMAAVKAEGKCLGGERIIAQGKCPKGISIQEARSKSAGATIQTPLLVFHNSFKISDKIGNFSRRSWRLEALKKDSNGDIYLTPYQLANVYYSGAICWGKSKSTSTPGGAYKSYFTSPFNADLTIVRSGESLKINLEQFDVYKNNNGWKLSADLGVAARLEDYETNNNKIKVPGDCSGIAVLRSENFLQYAEKFLVNNVAFARVLASSSGNDYLFTFGDGKIYQTSGFSAKAKVKQLPNYDRLLNPFSSIKKS